MQNLYFIAQFLYPQNFVQQGYQIVDQYGNATYSDINGNPLILPFDCEYNITSPDPQSPSWGT